MKGSRYTTAFFITLALLTTCGRNILPEPKRSPTIFIPSINGPSITSIGLEYFCLTSSVSSTMNSTIPFTIACFNLSPAGAFRHSSFFSSLLPFPFIDLANSINLSVESGLLLRRTSSTLSKNSLGISSYTIN